MIFDEAKWRAALSAQRVQWRDHAVRRMIRRGISAQNVLRVLSACEAIEEYPQDQPFPSSLFCGETDAGTIHVVAAFDADGGVIHVVTTYFPDEDHFVNGRRRVGR